jgi:hypothetical protein
LLSSAAQGTTLTVMARIGLRDLVYLLVAAFTTAEALDFGQQPHGIIDAVQAVTLLRIAIIHSRHVGRAQFGPERRLNVRSAASGSARFR